jgi:GntR family transcriptional regulator, transcriptional repressor for pyruvate dehydrogenase complex
MRETGRRRIHEVVLERIEEQIATGRLRVGDRLPAERDLAAELGVSRPAVREAIRVLEAMGTVVQGTGSGPDSGTLLSAVPGDALTHLISLHVMLASIGTADVVRARIALERESSRLAARHAAADDHATMERQLAAMDDPGITPEQFNDLDTAFHLAIARASGTVLVAELTTALRTAMRPTLLAALRAAPDFAAISARLAVEHHGIHQAIRDGDGDLAAHRVEAHIEGFYADRDADS